jgi:UDP-glucose 4-epimerase
MATVPEERPSAHRPICLVTGATGAIGPGVVAALSTTYDLRTFSRRPAEPRRFGPAVTSLVGDVTDAESLRRAARGAEVIVHLAALLHLVDPPPIMRAEYQRVNVGGTAAVIEAAIAENVSRVVVMSTIAVYGYQAGGRLDETSPCSPDTVYGETKLAAEQIALAAYRRDGAPLATVLRSAAVYGPRVKGNYQRLVHALARRRFVPVGPGDNLRTLIFDEDLASATALAAGHGSAAGRVYNVSDGTPHPFREIVAAICAALGRRPPRWHVPIGPVRAAVRAASVVKPGLPRMLDKYLEEVAVDASRIQAELGFRPRVGLMEGWKATIAEMQRTGRL